MHSKIFKLIYVALLFFLGQGNVSFAQNRIIKINPKTSRINFNIKHLGVLNVDGKYEDFQGKLVLQNKKVLLVCAKVSVNSINTGDKNRDKTLKGNEYLDFDNFPMFDFNSEISSSDIINGVLRIKEVSKPLKLKYQFSKEKSIQVLSISTEISRKFFELNFGSMNALMGDKIKVTITININ